MNFRRALMASSSHLWKRAVAFPPSSGVENPRIWKSAFTGTSRSYSTKRDEVTIHKRLEIILWLNNLEHDGLSQDVLKQVKSMETNKKLKGPSSTQGDKMKIHKKLENLLRLKNLDKDFLSLEILELVKSMERKKMSSHTGKNTIADAAARVQPSVVKLFVAKGFYGDTTSESTGSGTIIDESGLILTCAHVVLNTLKMDQTSTKRVAVTLTDGTTFNGEVVKYDLDIDITIVKIQHKKSFPAAKLGVSSEVCRRDWGNSGGPVVNLNGEVVGVHFYSDHASKISCAGRIDRCAKIIKEMSAPTAASDVDSSFAAPTVATTTGVKASTSAQAKVASTKKRKMCMKLRNLSETGGAVAEDLNQFIREKGAFVTQRDLFRWAKYLEKDGEDHDALEIFEWMERNHMSFSPSQHAIFLNLIAKTNGVKAASDYFKRIDPNFNNVDPREKNWPAYQKLTNWYFPESRIMRYVTNEGTIMNG